jgi:alcohol dehydrogenase class IV
MLPFDFVAPTRVLFGPGRFVELSTLAPTLGASCLVVTGRTFAKRTTLVDRVMESLEAGGVQGVVYNHITPNARAEHIDAAGKMAREAGVQFILGVGGGSVMDAAKGAAVMAANDGTIWDYAGGEPQRAPTAVLPVATLPTVAGSGAEVAARAMVTDPAARRQAVLRVPGCWPRFSLIDPALAVTAPPQPTAQAGTLAMGLTLEAMTDGAPPVLEDIAFAVCRSVLRSLPVAVNNPEHADARMEMAWASVMAGFGFTGCGGPAVHPLRETARLVAGQTDLGMGTAMAILIPGWLRLLREVHPDVVARIGARLFDLGASSVQAGDGGDRTIAALESWLVSIDMRTRFSDYSFGDEHFAAWTAALTVDAPNFYAEVSQLLGCEVGESQIMWMLQTCK